MSHDCDCSDCQETDSRWAYSRRMDRAKKDDCPKGTHIPGLWSTNPRAGEATYRCDACQVWCDGNGNLVKQGQLKMKNESNEDYRARMSAEMLSLCQRCGALGAHYCTLASQIELDQRTAQEILDRVDIKSGMNLKLLEASAPVCKKHPRYQAKRKPMGACESCWRRYVHLHPSE